MNVFTLIFIKNPFKFCLLKLIFKKLLEKLTDGGEEPVEVGAIGYVPNFMEEAKWFE